MTRAFPPRPTRFTALLAAVAALLAPTLPSAHEAPATAGESGPVPEILMEHAPMLIYKNGIMIPFTVEEDGTLFWFEILPEVEKSFAGPARWTWNEGEFCMFIDAHPTVCFELENELTAGKIYDSTVRYLHQETGKETGSVPFRFMLVRTK